MSANYFFGAWDYVVFGIMLIASASVGVYYGCFHKSQSTEEYLLGGRKMKTIPIAISLIASQMTGIAIMAIPAEMYVFGTQYWLVVFVMIIVVLIINYIFVPIFYNNHIANCYEYLEMRFSRVVREITTANFVISTYLLLPVIVFLPALAFAQVTGLNIHLINSVVCFVCIFYTMLGGIKAVVWTDVIQASVMLLSCILILIFGIIKVGGIGEVWTIADNGKRLELFNMVFDFTTRQTFWNMLFGNIVLWTTYVGLNQSCVQRIVAVPTINDARKALWIFGIGFIIIMTLNCFTGVVMYARFYLCDPIKAGLVGKPDKLMPFFVQDVVSHLSGMPGLFIACVFSAALSTMSANFNALSGIVYDSYIRPLNLFKHNDTTANLVMRILVVITGIYCVAMGFIVEQFNYIFQMVMTVTGVSHGAVFGVFTLGMLWPRANKHGALCGIIVSIIIMAWLVIGSSLAILRNELVYDTLPTTIEGCDEYGYNITQVVPAVPANVDSVAPYLFPLYRIAFPWFGVIGTILVWILALPVSFFTGSVKVKEMNKRLIAPIAQWLLPREVREAEDIQMTTTVGNANSN